MFLSPKVQKHYDFDDSLRKKHYFMWL